MWWTADRQAYAVNYLMRAAGLSLYGAAALVSRWKNVEASGGPASVNPSSGAFGIAQWLGSRLPPIRGNTSFDAQLAYAARELNGSESRAGQVLRSATNANAAAIGASMYERAEGYNASSGRDNFTARTAAGVASVLAASGTSGNSNGAQVAQPQVTGSSLPGDVISEIPDDSGNLTPVLIVGALGIILYLLL